MLRITWETMKERKWPVLIYSGASILLLWMYVALYPSMQAQSQQLAEVLKSMPAGLMKALGANTSEVNFTLEALLQTKQFGIVFQLLAGILAISIAGNDLADEVEKGTIEFLLSQPVSRFKLYFARFTSGTIWLTIFAAASTLVVIPLAKIYNVAYVAESYYKLFFIAWLFTMAVYAVSYFFSAAFSSKSRVFGIGAGLLIVMYSAFLVSALKDSLDKWKYISFFHYFSPDLLTTGTIDKLGVWIFVATIIICTTIGAVVFNNRDIAI